jgi:membrane protein implicated in regulation of membrane protease activity
MDYLRIAKVPVHPTLLIMVAVITPLMTFCLWGGFNTPAGFAGFMGAWFLQLWVLKYCFVLIERMADGAAEPPVMDNDMLSVLEARPWIQLALLAVGGWACLRIGGGAGVALAVVMVLWFPASVAILGHGERPWEPLNPVTVYKVVRGLGVHYLVLIGAMGVFALLMLVMLKLPWLTLQVALVLFCEVAFFALVGGVMFMRRQQIGYVPSRSPERAAAREETEREERRAKMLDDVFTNVRMGKHVDATAPLAAWMRDTEAEEAIRDSYHVAETALSWGNLAALNTIGSTLIRHLLRFGQADAALAVFETLRGKSPNFTMDSAADLRTLAEYAESTGLHDLAATMRLETPVFQPPR